MSDAIATELKLEWAHRQLEERDILIRSLRTNVAHLLDQLSDAGARIDTLKKVQDALTRDKFGAERYVEQLMQEKAELASENARLHISAKESAARAERAIRSAQDMQQIADARTQADELILRQTCSLGPAPSPERALQSQLQALKLVLSRVLHAIQLSGLQLDCAALLQQAMAESDSSGSLDLALRQALFPGATMNNCSFESDSLSARVPPEDARQVGPVCASRREARVVADRGSQASEASDSIEVAVSHAEPTSQSATTLQLRPSETSPVVQPEGALSALAALTRGFWTVLLGDSIEPMRADERPGEAHGAEER
jgi:hypothetical protein